LVKKTEISRENHQPASSQWQTLPHKVHIAMDRNKTHNIIGDRHWLYWCTKSPTTIQKQF